MLVYDLRLALRSLRRTPLLSALIVTGIALGIGITVAFVAVHRLFSGDPVPSRSDVLHYVRVDSWDPAKPFPGSEETGAPPIALTYMDAVALAASDVPSLASITYPASVTVRPEAQHERPFAAATRVCQADFFELMDVPFAHGGGWDRAADEARDLVCVLDDELNSRLFGGEDSVGRKVRLGERDFTVVGVIAPWKPSLRYWDVINSPVADPESLYMPFAVAIDMQVDNAGNDYGWGEDSGDGYEDYLHSESAWLGLWVGLDDPQAVEAYRSVVAAHVQEQKALGRCQRPLNYAVTPLLPLLDEYGVVPEEVSALLRMSYVFLLLCVVNVIGLLLGKFLAQAPEAGTRRALGASRWRIFRQLLVESATIGLAGGVVGLALGAGLLAWINRMPHGLEFHLLDRQVLSTCLVLSLGAGLCAGLYPAWRVCTLPPALVLKRS